MDVVLDFMGVLFSPAHVIRDGLHPHLKGRIPYRTLKEAYSRAVLGDSSLLDALVPPESQEKFLEETVVPADLSALKGHRFFGFTNLPFSWACFLHRKFLRRRLAGLFVSASMGVRKPSEEAFEIVERVVDFPPVFFDDKEANVQVARERGWRAKVVSPEGLASALESLTENR